MAGAEVVQVRYVGASLPTLDREKHSRFRKNLGKKCGIPHCKNSPTKIGHVWKDGDEKYCYTLPLCEEHTYDKLADNYFTPLKAMKTNPPERFNERSKCWCRKDLVPEEVYQGGYRVKNVQCSTIDEGDKSEWWSVCTGCDFSKQKCGIVLCGKKAEHGGHVWVEGHKDFCFILPLCASHNNHQNALSRKYHSSKPEARLVVRDRRENCTSCPQAQTPTTRKSCSTQ